MLLLDKEKLPEAERLAAAAQTVDLASDAFFKECYMEGMLFKSACNCWIPSQLQAFYY